MRTRLLAPFLMLTALDAHADQDAAPALETPLVVQWSASDTAADRALADAVTTELRERVPRAVVVLARVVTDPELDCTPSDAGTGPARICVSLETIPGAPARVRVQWTARAGDLATLVERFAYSGPIEALAGPMAAWLIPRVKAAGPATEPPTEGRPVEVVSDTPQTTIYVESPRGDLSFAGVVSPREVKPVHVPTGAGVRCAAPGHVDWSVRRVGTTRVGCQMVPVDDVLLITSNAPETRVWLDDTLLGGWHPVGSVLEFGPGTTRSTIPAGERHARFGLPPGPHRLCARAPGYGSRCWVLYADIDRRASRFDVFLPSGVPAPSPWVDDGPEALRETVATTATPPAASPAASPAEWHLGLWAGMAADRSSGTTAGRGEIGVELALHPGGSRWGVQGASHVSPAFDGESFGWGADLSAVLRPGQWQVAAGLGLRDRGQPYTTISGARQRSYVVVATAHWALWSDVAVRLGGEAGAAEQRAQIWRGGREATIARYASTAGLSLGLMWRM